MKSTQTETNVSQFVKLFGRINSIQRNKFGLLRFYSIFVENKGKMKILKLLLFNPHFSLVFLLVAVLFAIEIVIETFLLPFLYTLEGVELLIKKLLKLLK